MRSIDFGYKHVEFMFHKSALIALDFVLASWRRNYKVTRCDINPFRHVSMSEVEKTWSGMFWAISFWRGRNFWISLKEDIFADKEFRYVATLKCTALQLKVRWNRWNDPPPEGSFAQRCLWWKD